MHEWSLLIFTVCLQAAIGGVLMLSLFYKKISALGGERAFQVMRIPLLAIVTLSIVGLAASFTHLGTPSNALNTIRNLGSSWQSREILATGLFIGVICVTTGLGFVQKKVNFGLLLLSSVVGVVTIYCMGAIYANTLVSGWNSLNTYTSFFGTAFVLGPILAVSLIVPMLREEQQADLVKSLVRYSFIIAVLGIAVQLVGVALFGAAMPTVNMIGGTNALVLLADYQGTVALRWIIEIIGVAVLGYLSISKSKKLPLSFGYAALAVLFVAEGMSRYVFYILGA